MKEHSPSDNGHDQISNYLFNGHLSYSDNDKLPEELGIFINELEKTFAIVPEPNQSRMLANRSLFLTLGAELAMQQEPKKVWFGIDRLWQRLLWQGGVLAVFLLMSLLGIRMVSANSLPGEDLYLIKLSLEPLDGIFQNREQWEQKMGARRRQEVQQLMNDQREAKVYFEGVLEETVRGWQMMELPLVLTPEQQEIAHQSCYGHAVKVQGKVSKGSLQIIHLTPTCLELESIQLAKNGKEAK
jgi:hypothetical protein